MPKWLQLRLGDLAALRRALDARPSLTRERVPGYGGRTLLHIVADWPGYTPRGPQVARLLIERGADPNLRSDDDEHGESPLHWAASNDDLDVARALLDGGADMELPGGSIGTPLDNAIGYGCWHVAELLARRGAVSRSCGMRPPWVASTFWKVCWRARQSQARSRRRSGTLAPRPSAEPAERLLEAGADIDWTPDYADGTPLDVATDLSPGNRTSWTG